MLYHRRRFLYTNIGLVNLYNTSFIQGKGDTDTLSNWYVDVNLSALVHADNKGPISLFSQQPFVLSFK